MANGVTGEAGELDATKRDLIEATVQKELQFSTKLMPHISDVSQFAEKGAKTISFPKLTSFTAVDRAEGVAGTMTVLSDSVDTMALDQNAYVSWLIDSMSAMQTSINSQIEFARRAASAHARFVDSAIRDEAEVVGIPTATTSVLITLNIILEMRKSLRLNNGDLDKASFWFNPTQEEALLKIAEFTRADAYGSSNIPSGVIGRVFGIPVVIANVLNDDEYYLVESDGLSIGFQKGVSQDSQPANEYGVGAERHAMDQLFGVKGLEIAASGTTAGAGESALVIRDANA